MSLALDLNRIQKECIIRIEMFYKVYHEVHPEALKDRYYVDHMIDSIDPTYIRTAESIFLDKKETYCAYVDILRQLEEGLIKALERYSHAMKPDLHNSLRRFLATTQSLKEMLSYMNDNAQTHDEAHRLIIAVNAEGVLIAIKGFNLDQAPYIKRLFKRAWLY